MLGKGNAICRIAYKIEVVQMNELPKEGKTQPLKGLGYLVRLVVFERQPSDHNVPYQRSSILFLLICIF